MWVFALARAVEVEFDVEDSVGHAVNLDPMWVFPVDAAVRSNSIRVCAWATVDRRFSDDDPVVLDDVEFVVVLATVVVKHGSQVQPVEIVTQSRQLVSLSGAWNAQVCGFDLERFREGTPSGEHVPRHHCYRPMRVRWTKNEQKKTMTYNDFEGGEQRKLRRDRSRK
jgi:hypothetical protein